MTLTCAFDASNVGVYGEVEYSAQLMYSVSLPACDGQTDVEMQQTSVVADNDSSDRGGERNTGEAGGGVSCRPTPACRRVSVSCGRIVVKASEVLQVERAMSALMTGADSLAGDLQDFGRFLCGSVVRCVWELLVCVCVCVCVCECVLACVCVCVCVCVSLCVCSFTNNFSDFQWHLLLFCGTWFW